MEAREAVLTPLASCAKKRIKSEAKLKVEGLPHLQKYELLILYLFHDWIIFDPVLSSSGQLAYDMIKL